MNPQRKPQKEAGSDYIIEKDDGLCRLILLVRDVHCQKCGSRVNLVVSHCLGKKAWPSLRHDLQNLLLLCQDCHDNWWHAHLYDAWIWFVNNYRERYDYISRAKNQYIKLNKQHYQDTAIELEAELERLKGE